MLKPWATVRSDICREYASGKSLESIREWLIRERDFEASIRMLRLKIKAWKYKRSDTGARKIESGEVPLGGTHRVTKQKSECTVPALRPRILNSAQASLEHEYLEFSRLGRDELQLVLPSVVRTWEGQDGHTNLLHFACTQYDSSIDDHLKLIEALLHAMRQENIELDMSDGLGRTALELSIRTKKSCVTELLLNQGASVDRANNSGRLPLHVALLEWASPATVERMLQHGADPERAFSTGSSREIFSSAGSVTPLELIAQALATSASSDEKLAKLFRIAHLLVTHKARFDVTAQNAVVTSFIAAWAKSAGPSALLESARPLLRRLLRDGYDPTSRADITTSPMAGCANLLHIAFFHSPNEALGELLVRDCRLDIHATSLVREALNGCIHSVPAKSPASWLLVRLLLRRDFAIDSGFGVIEHVLRYTPERMKVSFLEVLLDMGPYDCHVKSTDEARHWVLLDLVAACSHTETRYRLAELVLQGKGGAPTSLAIRDLTKQVRSDLFDRSLPLQQVRDGLKYGGRRCTKQVFGCILHAITQSVIQDATYSDPSTKQRIRAALEMRAEYELPDIAMRNALVLSTLHEPPMKLDDFHQQQHAVLGQFYRH